MSKTTKILIAGFGGQGILFAGKALDICRQLILFNPRIINDIINSTNLNLTR